MKKFLALIALVSLSISGADAACGKKVTTEGKLKSFEAEKKSLTVVGADGKDVTLTLTPSSTGADTVATMVGKSVKVVSEHGKIDSVAAGS